MWKLPLEFDNIPPSRSGAQRRVRKKVKTPLIPRVKTSQYDTIQRRIWVSPQFDDDMQYKAKEERGQRQRVRKSVRLLDRPTDDITDNGTTSSLNYHPKLNEKKSKKKQTLRFTKKTRQTVAMETTCESVTDEVSDNTPKIVNDLGNCVDEISVNSDQLSHDQSHDSMVFNPPVSSTPRSVRQSVSCHFNSEFKLSLDNINLSSDESETVLANETPSHLFECGLNCKLKGECRH